ncbi:MAG TPA: hypothetical protein VNP04_01790 [Alphaproteobacteria bacterium]|nr:hypothetical protein [Alphaproteobacteria bacterium]
MPRCDAVFEGGGVKGIGLVGAVAVTEAMGYEFCDTAREGALQSGLQASGGAKSPRRHSDGRCCAAR